MSGEITVTLSWSAAVMVYEALVDLLAGPGSEDLTDAQIVHLRALRDELEAPEWVAPDNTDIVKRLEYLRSQINAERISYSEVHELQDLADQIEPGDVQLLEWAGVPEFPEDESESNIR